MTREQIIRKAEIELNFTWEMTKQGLKHGAIRGLAQLDMVFYLLDEEWDKYDMWFNIFMECM